MILYWHNFDSIYIWYSIMHTNKKYTKLINFVNKFKFVDQMLLINNYPNLLISTICKLGSIVKVAVVMLSGI